MRTPEDLQERLQSLAFKALEMSKIRRLSDYRIFDDPIDYCVSAGVIVITRDGLRMTFIPCFPEPRTSPGITIQAMFDVDGSVPMATYTVFTKGPHVHVRTEAIHQEVRNLPGAKK